jgi:Ca-activated chloride channel family protein
MDPSTFRFLFPQWLLLLPLLWGLLWFFSARYRRSSIWGEICDTHLLQQMRTGSPGEGSSRWIVVTLTLLMSLAIVAAAGPSWRSEYQSVSESSAARVVALDLSRLMLVQDIKPNRFARALEGARKIVSSEFDGETGLIVFSGATFVVSPLSRDANTLLAFLKELNPETMPVDGNRIDFAINAAQRLLQSSVAGYGQIYIITGGSDSIEATVQAAYRANQQGNQVSVLAIGTTAGGPLVNSEGGLVRDSEGKFVLAKTDFPSLSRIAQVGNGAFFKMTDSGVPVSFFTAQLNASVIKDSEAEHDNSQQIPTNDGYWLIWLVLPLSLLLFRKNTLWVLLIISWMPGDYGVYASDWNAFWNHSEHRAFEAFKEHNYSLAASTSNDSMLKGSALYRSNQYAEALDTFKHEHSARSFYNQGNAYAFQQQFPEAVIAYKTALKLKPDYIDAAFNKNLIEIFLIQQFESENEADGDDEDGEAASETDQNSTQSRLGTMRSENSNPADDQQPGSGIGASAQLGQLEENEPFEGAEERLEPLPPTEQANGLLPDPKLIEQWIKSLPQASSELFRRKFLRDYERQNLQQR